MTLAKQYLSLTPSYEPLWPTEMEQGTLHEARIVELARRRLI
jgi:hypothetical protein